jgi:4-azaleucine resistance transporter AzlC
MANEQNVIQNPLSVSCSVNQIRLEADKLSDIRRGALASVPVVIGYLALSVAYGILARKSGLGLLETVALSALVYAGACQFIAVGMIAAGADPAAIIVTTLLVNLRHILYSASLAPYMQRFKCSHLAVLAFSITDESFALASSSLPQKPESLAYLAGLQLAPYLAWNAGSLLGALVGVWIGGIQQFGLDFALPAMFIALLMGQINDRLLVVTAIVAGLLSLLIALFVKGSWNVILAALITATLGMGWQKWRLSSGS